MLILVESHDCAKGPLAPSNQSRAGFSVARNLQEILVCLEEKKQARRICYVQKASCMVGSSVMVTSCDWPFVWYAEGSKHICDCGTVVPNQQTIDQSCGGTLLFNTPPL